MWMTVTMKRKTPARNLNYINKLYQNEIDRLNSYMSENGLILSIEKGNMISKITLLYMCHVQLGSAPVCSFSIP